MIKENVKRFGLINIIEGYSYIILVFIAMPMKYLLGLPVAVKVAGMTHGILFIIFCIFLLKAAKEAQWPFMNSVIFFIASLIPFGTFLTKSKIKTYE
ncbi:DUF3817 domain-containing protein [Candidatus Sulfurimonas marisnigri]|uniref:DUF3817 domain-containing protein n=1 Tax=Candidatus Sulfurimonas marisnigri TaxID=2740405 RepID=A0A7S7RPU5_9BACT|nr:DUF3817 domain-containing protein [Candidatus Sulfurimonas marisnigri]QOY53775.1 DUF3817 domain-containing protein [Candidatus Sulfurimonas marisnigri]